MTEDAGSTSGGSTSTGDDVDPTLASGSVSSATSSSSGSDTTGEVETEASSSSTTGDAPLSVCDPQPDGPRLPLLIEALAGDPTGHIELVDDCQVDAVDTQDGLLEVSFACAMGPFRVSLTTPTVPDLQVQDAVELSLFVDSPWWSNAYVKVMRDGELALAAMAGEALPGGSTSYPPEDFFAPLGLELLTDVCDAEPAPDDGTGFLGGDPCTQDRRLAITFALEGDSTTVFDRNAGSIGDLSVHVGETVHYEEVTCTDTPGGWREFIAVRPLRVAKR